MTIPPGTLCIWPLAFPTAHNHTPHQAHTSTMSPIFELHYSFYPFTLKKVTEVNIEGAVLWTYSTAKPQKTKSCFLHCLSKINDLFFFSLFSSLYSVQAELQAVSPFEHLSLYQLAFHVVFRVNGDLSCTHWGRQPKCIADCWNTFNIQHAWTTKAKFWCFADCVSQYNLSNRPT